MRRQAPVKNLGFFRVPTRGKRSWMTFSTDSWETGQNRRVGPSPPRPSPVLPRFQPYPSNLLSAWIASIARSDPPSTATACCAASRSSIDTAPAADIRHGRALPKLHVSLPKQAHDLLCTASLRHQSNLFSSGRSTRIPTQELPQDLGRESRPRVSHVCFRHRGRSWSHRPTRLAVVGSVVVIMPWLDGPDARPYRSSTRARSSAVRAGDS